VSVLIIIGLIWEISIFLEQEIGYIQTMTVPIGVINASSYNMNEDADFTWADSLLFYDPVTKISLLTFDWS